VAAADDLVYGPLVVGIGGADEAVRRDAQGVLCRAKELHHLIHEGLGALALLRGGHGDVHRVLVRTGQEARPITGHAMPAG
jgi:hypothetical protein